MDHSTKQTVPSLYQLRTLWTLNIILGLIPVLVGLNVGITSAFLPSALQGWGDFRQLYSGGYMFRIGERQNFYDYNTQLRYEQSLVPIPTHLPVNHLAYEHLLFVPFSLLPYKPAYLIFLGVNIGLAALAAWWLLPSGQNLTLRWRFYVPWLMAAFLPIWRALLQGQDSILLLALLTAAMFALDRRPLMAGLLVGAGLFKFQIVLPIALLFVAWRHWRFVWGFCASSAVAVAISLWMVGTQGMQQYFQMMAGMSVHLKSQEDVVRYATSPLAMLNLRGLITGTLGRWLPHFWIQALIVASSICVLLIAARKMRGFRAAGEKWASPNQFSIAVLAASLVSYHFIEHDASILIIPVIIALASLSAWAGVAAVGVFVGMLAGLAQQYAFLGALPMIVLFLVETKEAGRRELALPNGSKP